MQTLSVETLKPIAHSQVDPIQFDRHTELLNKNEAGSLTASEEHELTSLRQAAEQLMLRNLCLVLASLAGAENSVPL